MNEWREVTLGEVCTIRRGSSPRPIKEFLTHEDGMPWIKIADATESDSRYIETTNEFIKHEGVPKSVIVQEGDLILSNSGTAGLPKFIKFTACIHDGWQVFQSYNGIDKFYLYYYLLFIRHNLLHNAYDSTMKNLTLDMLRDYSVNLPTLPEQKAIADTLSCLDDKIELNNKLNQNLEEQAFTLFERMFDIDNSTILLSEIAEINHKRTLPKKTLAKCIDMTKLSTSGCFPTGWIQKEFLGGMKFQNGDTLIARITPCLENGKTAYINFLADEEIAFGSTEYVVISPKQGYCGEFFYCLARYPNFVSYAVQNMNGTSGRQRVSGATIGEYEIPVPDSVLLQEFNHVVPSLFDVIKKNSLENIRLAEIRNTLLPKLMSGEVRVPLGEG